MKVRIDEENICLQNKKIDEKSLQKKPKYIQTKITEFLGEKQ